RGLVGDSLYGWDDFEATIRFLTPEGGGRVTPPMQGYKPEFFYLNGVTEGYMIWPDFLAADGSSLPEWTPLEVGSELRARMYILSNDLRKQVHRNRIVVETEFCLCEGGRTHGHGQSHEHYPAVRKQAGRYGLIGCGTSPTSAQKPSATPACGARPPRSPCGHS